MWKATIVSAIALTMGMAPLAAADFDDGFSRGRSESSAPIIKESHITRLKAVLNLSPSQQPFWVPVEAALRDLARQQSRDVAGVGFVQRMSDRASSVASEAMRLRRLMAAARPLIRVLDDEQKREAMVLARHYGFERLVASF
jgi:hypothetical protein